MKNGYVIIKHQVFRGITDEEVLAFLPTDHGTPKYQIFDVKKQIVAMENIHMLDNVEYSIYQKRLIDQEIKPFLSAHPDYQVLYFGTATIPLALHFGFCFGSWHDVQVYLLSREKGVWEGTEDGPAQSCTSAFVQEEFTGPIDVIYKVEATYLAQDSDMKEVVENPHKLLTLRLDNIGKDVFKSQEQMKQFAYQFSLGIDAVANYLPNADRIHLFPTVPVGLAFLMGAKLNPLVTKPIVTYQYNINNNPKYEQVLILQENNLPEMPLEENDRKQIAIIKQQLHEILTNKIAPLVRKDQDAIKRSGGPVVSWVSAVLPAGQQYPEMEHGYWKNLPAITQTILDSSSLSEKTDLAGDGFYISESNEWQINDRLLFNLITRLKDHDRVLRAMRLFVFHESLHIFQKLTNYTAANIGRFPRVLEEADYIADVWAMLHEYYFASLHDAAAINNPKDFFKMTIDVALNTMLAFDDIDPNTDEMQVRRVNRYLIWYWNYLQIEDRSCQTLADITQILAHKPILEIRGLDIRAQSQRTILRLTNYRLDELELGYMDSNGKIFRIGHNAGGLDIDNIVKGFRERDGQKILRELKSWYHQIRQ